MNLPVTFQIARTHLLSRKRQTVIAALGVTFGISLFIFMIGFMTGVNNLLEEISLSATPHIHIYRDVAANRPTILSRYHSDSTAMRVVHHPKPKDEPQNLRSGFQMMAVIKNDPRVAGVSPLLNAQVFYNYGTQQIGGTIAGVDILEEDKLFDISGKLTAGQIQNLLSASNGVIMGSGLAKKLNVGLSDRVRITTTDGVQLLLTIVGLIQTGVTQVDNTRSYATLATVQKILQTNNRYITDINVKLHDLEAAKPIAAEYESTFGYRAEDWETANATIQAGSVLRDSIAYAVVLTILTVAGFGIYNILNMTIYEKMKDIAILKAMGFSGRDVTRIFMTQAITIGLLGGLVGMAVGFGLSYAVSRVPFKSDALINIDHLPVNFDPVYYMIALVFGMLTTGLAGYLPARKAAHVDPVEIIRGK